MPKSLTIPLVAMGLVGLLAFVAFERAGVPTGDPPPDSVVVRLAREMLASGALGPPVGRDGEADPRLVAFYGDTAGAVLWVDGRAPSPMARDLLNELERSAREGLHPDSLHRATVRGSFRGLDEARPTAAALARTELLVSGTFLALADAVARGVTEPAPGGLHWDLERDPVPGADLLGEVARGARPADLLERLRPGLPTYGRLVDALARYEAVARGGGWPRVTPGETAAVGDTAEVVAQVRARLRAGVDRRERELASRNSAAPRTFDDGLARALGRFQQRHDLARDSVVGPETVAALNVAVEERIATLRLTLDRLRGMPRSLGERAILVNVAGFELLVLEGERPVLSMDVVVGQPENRTRVFTADLQYVVFNPWWHVPESIARNEILPALREDPAYLRENRLEVVDADDREGDPVVVDDMDWARVDTASWPYGFRQKPGPENSLGRVKFMMPNEHDIYLHDTPADHLFSRTVRAFSHGCIRLERAEDLARYVLEHATDRSPDDVRTLMEAERTERVDLTRPIPVYIVYLTAWVDDDGTVRFHRDPYALDPSAGPLQGPGRE